MRKTFRQLSAALLIAALAGTLTLLAMDAANHLSLTFAHQRTGALSFMLVGASYISLLFSDSRPWREKMQGLLLAAGFLLWGGEQFMPPGPLTTAVDSLVVLIFVNELGLVIVNKLKHKGGELF